MKKDLQYYLIPICLIIYLLISWTPLLLNLKQREFFPFSAFNLYSFLPDKIEEKKLYIEENGINRIYNFWHDPKLSQVAKNEIDKKIKLCTDLKECDDLRKLVFQKCNYNVVGIVHSNNYYYQLMRGDSIRNIIENLSKND